MQIKVSPHKSMLSKDKNNAVTKKRKLSENCCLWFFYMKKQKAKQNDYNGRSDIFSVFSFRWKSHTHSITNIRTHTWLCTPPSESKCISNIPALCCNFFHMISFFHFLPPFLSFSFCMRGKWKQRWNPVIELFFIHAAFLCKYGAVKCKLNSADGRHRGLARRCEIPLGYHTIPHLFLSHLPAIQI